MDLQLETDNRPRKKRRFFVEDDDLQTPLSESSEPDNAMPSTSTTDTSKFENKAEGDADGSGFDVSMLEAVVGRSIDQITVDTLKQMSGGNIERAVNMFLDGSWQDSLALSVPKSKSAFPTSDTVTPPAGNKASHHIQQSLPRSNVVVPQVLKKMPEWRYVGALGVEGWATRSGTNLIQHGDIVKIERSRRSTPAPRGAKATQVARSAHLHQREDVIVRFTNSGGSEIGRLPKETASWVSTLIDQKTCRFEATCVYAPEIIRTNETIYLQLRCSILGTAFTATNFKPLETNRKTGIFEAKESGEERELRLRQVAMVKLFEEINLNPRTTNEVAEKHKRKGLLLAAEQAEKRDQEGTAKKSDQSSSTPPNEETEEGQELEQDQLDNLYKKAQSFDFNTPEEEPASSFAMDLRGYQKQALYWMMAKEKDQKKDKAASMHPLWEEYAWPRKDMEDKELAIVEGQDKFYVNPYSGEMSLNFPIQEQNCLGGILADEMGLGKTIEMLALMHSHKSELPETEATPSASLNLPRLPKNSATVERAPATTLVIAPMSLLAQWQSEAENASKPGTMKSIVYYGNDKSANLQSLCCESNAASAPNLIITSYGVVLSEFGQVTADNGNRGSHGGLFSLEFFRVILDEAHHIKNRQSKTAKACYELAARHRWVLTGTPIVNRLEDLFSLVRFLRVEPWSNFSFWKTFITVPFESKDFLRALDVVQTVLEPLVLRRTKDMKTPDGQALVALPPKTIMIEEIELSKPEREVYDYIFTRAKRTFAANVEAGTVMKSYTSILAQILRLRQSCCHPLLTRNKNIVADEEDAAAAADLASGLADDMDLQVLIDRFTLDNSEQDANAYGAHVLKQIQAEATDECPLCFEEPMNDPVVTGCWHSACKTCLLDYIEHQKEKGEYPRCFNCREAINQRDVFEVIRHEKDDLYDDSNNTETHVTLRRVGSDSSAKIGALLTHLKRVRREGPQTKSVVFSQFTSFMDLIEPALERDRISFLRFDGAMTQKARATVLEEFKESKKGLVLLLSLRAGGVGLNLTMARNVFMCDPWWSYAVEAQAVDRVHRMGQQHPVNIHRFIIKDSVEQRMLKIQDRKKFLATSLGMATAEEKRVQRLEDIKELLS